jgi:hypothetical protein
MRVVFFSFLDSIRGFLCRFFLIGGRAAVRPKVGETLAHAVHLHPLEEQPGAHGILRVAPLGDVVAAPLRALGGGGGGGGVLTAASGRYAAAARSGGKPGGCGGLWAAGGRGRGVKERQEQGEDRQGQQHNQAHSHPVQQQSPYF